MTPPPSEPGRAAERHQHLVPVTPDAGALADARAFQQRRVRSYLGFLVVLFGASFVFDSVSLGLSEGPAALLQTGQLVVLALVLVLGGGWLGLATRALPEMALGGIEIGTTLGVAGAAVAVLQGIAPDTVAAGPMLAMALMLVARAAVVPSSGTRTAVVGTLVTLLTVLGYRLRSADTGHFAEFTLPWLGAFTLASAFVSRVIYGLQRQVRRAYQLGQYVLEGQLGEGGMGVVFRARHQLLRRPTAVKLMARQTRERDAARFEREVRQTARLSHPNTVTVYDYGRTVEGVFYYAMELLEGATLDAVVERTGPLAPARVRRILAAIAGALAEAHGVQLIQRDIKPANVMLCEQGGEVDVVKVLDFGLVKDLSDATELTHDGALTGTPAFMAPEAIQDPARVGPASDLYALGALGYFLLTGVHVFDGKSIVEVCSHHLLTAPVPPSRRVGRELPGALERLVLDCLEKTPERRPASARALRERLSALAGLDDWTETAARAWWDAHREALRRDGVPERSPLAETLAVDWALRN